MRLLQGDFVTADAGTGFVHIAPGHGADDYELGVANGVEVPRHGGRGRQLLSARAAVRGLQVYTSDGKKGTANKVVTEALDKAGKLLASGRITHSYPHSWRSKAPVIFRNAPQWFIAMDKPIAEIGGTLREKALAAIDATRFVPRAGYNRLRSMIEHAARLVRVAPARLGRADRGVRRQGDRRAVARSRGDGAAWSRPSRPRAPTPGSKARPSASSATSTRPRISSR